MSCQRVLSQLDVVDIIADSDTDTRVLPTLARLSRGIRVAAKQAMARIYDPRKFLAKMLVAGAAEFVLSLLWDGAIISGPAVIHYLRRGDPLRGSILILVPHRAFKGLSAVLIAHGYRQISSWSGSWDGTDGVDDSEPFRSEPITQMAQFRQGDARIWVGTPRVSALHAVLHQRSTAVMNGLTSAGFFALYPAATFVDSVAAVTHVPPFGPVPEDAVRPFGEYRMRHMTHWDEDFGPRPLSLKTGRRQFGDGASWLIDAPLEGCDGGAFAELRRNTWALGTRTFRRVQDGEVPQSETVIWTSIITSTHLVKTYVGTAHMKSAIIRTLARIAAVIPESRLDNVLGAIMEAASSERDVTVLGYTIRTTV